MQVHVSCLYVENEIESLKKKLCECPPRILVIDFLRDKIMLSLHYTQSSVDQPNQAAYWSYIDSFFAGGEEGK